MRRFKTMLTALLACLAGTAACDSEPAAPEGRAAAVTGTVARLKTGEGVPNLLVALVDGGDIVSAAATGPDGSFGFAGVPHGTYDVRLSGLELAGLRPATTAFEPAVRQVTVTDATPAVMFAAVGLFTQVQALVTCDGAPVAGAGVWVVGGSTDAAVTTNAVGEVVATVDPGHYSVILPDPPCPVAPGYRVVEVRQGQTVPVHFDGGTP